MKFIEYLISLVLVLQPGLLVEVVLQTGPFLVLRTGPLVDLNLQNVEPSEEVTMTTCIASMLVFTSQILFTNML